MWFYSTIHTIYWSWCHDVIIWILYVIIYSIVLNRREKIHISYVMSCLLWQLRPDSVFCFWRSYSGDVWRCLQMCSFPTGFEMVQAREWPSRLWCTVWTPTSQSNASHLALTAAKLAIGMVVNLWPRHSLAQQFQSQQIHANTAFSAFRCLKYSTWNCCSSRFIMVQPKLWISTKSLEVVGLVSEHSLHSPQLRTGVQLALSPVVRWAPYPGKRSRTGSVFSLESGYTARHRQAQLDIVARHSW